MSFNWETLLLKCEPKSTNSPQISVYKYLDLHHLVEIVGVFLTIFYCLPTDLFVCDY